MYLVYKKRCIFYFFDFKATRPIKAVIRFNSNLSFYIFIIYKKQNKKKLVKRIITTAVEIIFLYKTKRICTLDVKIKPLWEK